MISIIPGPPCPECGLANHGHAIGCSQLEVEQLRLAMPLLRKLASGEGGQRTGALKRAGYLEWTVTARGYAALLEASGATLGKP